MAKGQDLLMDYVLALGPKEAPVSGTTSVRLGARRDEAGKVDRTSFLFKWKDVGCLMKLQVLNYLLGDPLGSFKQRRKIIPLSFWKDHSVTVFGTHWGGEETGKAVGKLSAELRKGLRSLGSRQWCVGEVAGDKERIHLRNI